MPLRTHTTTKRRNPLAVAAAAIVLLGWIAAMSATELELPPEEAIVDVGSRRYLFVDDALVDADLSQQVALEVHPPVGMERVVTPDRPWEAMGFHYFSQVMNYGRLYQGQIYDYLLYYRRMPMTALTGEPDEAGAYCVALSHDGVTWEKPLLSQATPFQGETTNCTDHGFQFVLVDPHAPLQSRFKKIGHLSSGAFGITGVSADGLDFSAVEKRLGPLHENGTIYHLDTQNVGWWDVAQGRFNFVVRGWNGELIDGKWQYNRRSVHTGHIAATDLSSASAYLLDISTNPTPRTQWDTTINGQRITWYALTTELPAVMETDLLDWQDWQVGETARVDIYHSAAAKYPWAADTYLAFPTLYHHYTDNTTPVKLNNNDGEFRIVEVAASRDGQTWRRYRVADGFAPYVQGGDLDGVNMLMVSMGQGMIRQGDQIYQYFIALPRTHGLGAYFDGDYRLISASPETQQAWVEGDKGGVYRLVQRLDGFISMAAGEEEGLLVTLPFTFAGEQLLLNYQAAGEGYVEVALLDAEGEALPGRGFADADRLMGDAVSQPVSWQGVTDVSAWAGQPVRLALRMRQANVFAFEFAAPAGACPDLAPTAAIDPEQGSVSLAWPQSEQPFEVHSDWQHQFNPNATTLIGAATGVFTDAHPLQTQHNQFYRLRLLCGDALLDSQTLGVFHYQLP